MAFLRKKRIKFSVELVVDKLTDVSLLNANLFAKVRLLDCGSFEACTTSNELRNHICHLYSPHTSTESDRFLFPDPPSPDSEDTENRPTGHSEDPKEQPFRFQCRIPYNDQTGELEECRCKISIRKTERAGRPPTKLGFVIVNLSEYAASGSTPIQQSYLLDGYTGRQRQDNTRVHLAIRMFHQMSDPLFKVPSTAIHMQETPSHLLNPVDRKAPSHNQPPSMTNRPNDEEIRRRLDPRLDTLELAEEEARPQSTQPTPGVATPNLPHSSTLASLNSDQGCAPNPSPPPPTGGVSNTPANRYSHPFLLGERRPSAPQSSVERTSWHAGTEQKASSTVGSGFSNDPQYLEMRRNCQMRRLSEDRLPTHPNVSNRVQQTRRDADSVIEEVLAEAAAQDPDDSEDRSINLDHSAEESDPTPEPLVTPKKTKRGLALFVSRRNGDVLLASNQCPPSSFERVQLDSTISG
ncbi:unnamed protein product [Bursaphelenchus xylophilus]|uniref:(pine wood nematode) hypothetical protein n=1 Tax=Bursaphelenchus xylophilus TaxID=6326 RepID=A0A1I7SLB9_BURXY|nr:unnamed protein product [Bursaphelenchus xylophilus]CAG9129476.1 unnamed protein product [Bursaphelenchus xylophilus]